MGTGAAREFDEFVVVAWPRLVRTALLLGCSPVDAEDVVQTALTRCLVKWARVRRADDRDAYVHRILVNTFITARRRRWHRERPTEHVPELPAEDATLDVVRRDTLRRSLDRLSVDQRVAVVLRYYANLSEGQMAEVLEVAPGTIKSRLSRALKALEADPELADREGLM